MADNQSNFRTQYYKKFGLGSGEEKKSIENLLKEHPLNIDKLKHFCQFSPLPAVYRVTVWKYVLGIIPRSQKSLTFVMNQRCAQFDDLKHALRLMHRIKVDTPISEIFLKMFQLEEGLLLFDDTGMMAHESSQAFMAMADAVSNIVEDDIDRYWITTSFYRYFRTFEEHIPNMIVKTEQFIKQEDSNPKLWDHMHNCRALSSLPLDYWFQSCFAGTLPDSSFERVWDIVIGGSLDILVFVAVSILLTFRRPLLSMNTAEDMVKYLNAIPTETGDILVSKAIDMWLKVGGSISHGKSNSPSQTREKIVLTN